MNNKVLVKVTILELGISYDIFLPVNELIWKLKKLMIKSISDLVNVPELYQKDFLLLNKITGEIYRNNDVLIDTNIRNATELILLSI